MNCNFVREWATVSFVYFFSYLLNFLWESVHLPLLYECELEGLQALAVLLRVSAIDATLISAVYLGGMFLFGSRWLKDNLRKGIAYAVPVLVLIAAIIEYKAVYLFNQWSYSELMPTIFGLGISPLLQLAATGMLSFCLCKHSLKNF